MRSKKSKPTSSSRTPERSPYRSVEMVSKKSNEVVNDAPTSEQGSPSVERRSSIRTSNSNLRFEIKRSRDRQGFYNRFNQALDKVFTMGSNYATLIVLDHVRIRLQNLSRSRPLLFSFQLLTILIPVSDLSRSVLSVSVHFF